MYKNLHHTSYMINVFVLYDLMSLHLIFKLDQDNLFCLMIMYSLSDP